MQKIIEKDWQYTFYQTEQSQYILSVLCGSVAMYDLNITLNADETAKYKAQGEAYIDQLAAQISQSPDRFKARHQALNTDTDGNTSVSPPLQAPAAASPKRYVVFHTDLHHLPDICPECKKPMYGTGKMTLDPTYNVWVIQYYCYPCMAYREQYNPAHDALTKSLEVWKMEEA